MSSFKKLKELQNAKKELSGTNKKCTKDDYLKALKGTFNIDAKKSDIHKSF